MISHSRVERSYRICPNCNNVSVAKKEQRFCIWCGTKLVEECPGCSKPIIHSNGKFCYNCGAQYNEVRKLADGGEELQQKGVLGGANWAQEQTRRLKVKLSIHDLLARRRP